MDYMSYQSFGSIYGNFMIHSSGKVYKVKYNQWIDMKYWKLQDEKTANRIKKELLNFNKTFNKA